MDCIFDCATCPTGCDGISKGNYIFQDDVAYSEEKERFIISQINDCQDFIAEKCMQEGYPDIEVTYQPTGAVFYVEVKAQRRTFMKVSQLLPESNLFPSETLALNESDLKRYFQIREMVGRPIFILWCLENRPCIVPEGETRFFYQDTQVLEDIYQQAGNTRKFRRDSGYGDYVDGRHKGVTVNYHFSLRELDELDLNELFNRGLCQ